MQLGAKAIIPRWNRYNPVFFLQSENCPTSIGRPGAYRGHADDNFCRETGTETAASCGNRPHVCGITN